MNTVKINKGRAKIIAHRGLSGLERENTASAFVAEKLVSWGVQYITSNILE